MNVTEEEDDEVQDYDGSGDENPESKYRMTDSILVFLILLTI